MCLFFLACSGHIDAVDTHHAASTTGGSGGTSVAAGPGGSTAGTGEAGGPGVTTSTTTGATTAGAGGHGGGDPPEAGTDPVDAGVDAADDRGADRGDVATGDAGASAIDWSIWQLQLPTGSGTSPTTVQPAELATFSNIYFYKADDGGQIFMSPAAGVTTPNSTRCRTELRESNPSGGEAAWSPAGTNVMTVTGKVVKGSGITVGQVFNGGDGITLAELQYSTNGFTLFYEEARGQGQSTNLGNRTALDTRYTFVMEFSKNVLTVSLNGRQVFTRTPSASISASSFYFKAGNYDQTTSRGTPGTTAHSIVENYAIAVVHQ